MTAAVSKHIEPAYHGAKLLGSLVPGTTPLVKTIQYILFATTGSVSKPCTPGEHQNSW